MSPATVGQRSIAGRREQNEDHVRLGFVPRLGFVGILADGMGGHAGGEVASRLACEALLAELGAGADLRGAVKAANQAVFQAAKEGGEKRGMGTTLVAVLVLEDGSYLVANVGDSRAYRVKDGEAVQVTTDHSFVEQAVQEGKMSREEAERSAWRNSLTRSLGSDPDVEVDIFGPYAPEEPHFLLLCSDGVSKSVDPETMAAVLEQTADAEEGAQLLTDLAVARGSDDNVSAVILDFGQVPRAARTLTLPLHLGRTEPAKTEPIPDEEQQQVQTWKSTSPPPRRLGDRVLVPTVILLAITVAYLVLAPGLPNRSPAEVPTGPQQPGPEPQVLDSTAPSTADDGDPLEPDPSVDSTEVRGVSFQEASTTWGRTAYLLE